MMIRHPSAFRFFLLLTAGLTGALVMAVEVLGARVLAPFFGVSLFVWTALIAVTLLALALGYLAGGRWADSSATPSLLYQLIAAAGFLLLAVPLAKPAVLQFALSLGLRWGALSSALALFGLPLFLLGCVSPLLVRLAAQEWSRLGRTVGLMYAVSTTGSFIGTLASGYYFIAVWGMTRAFQFMGLALICLGTLYFVLFRGRVAVAVLPLIAVLASMPAPARLDMTLSDGTVARVLESQDSFYGRVQVVDYLGSGKHTRELTIDGLIQGGVDVDTGRSVYEYSYLLEHLAVAANPMGRRGLVIGLGSGVVPRRFVQRGIETVVVDIDPVVVNMARKYFGLPGNQQVRLVDARYFLTGDSEKYDYIILDVFNGDTTPGYLLTQESLKLVRERLSKNGVMTFNLIGRLGEDRRMTASVVRTLQSVFAWVQVYPLFDPGEGKDSGNIVIAAGIGKPLGEVPPLDESDVDPMARDILRDALARRFSWSGSEQGIVLSDDFNPIDVLDLPLKETVRRQILESTPIGVLLS